MQMAVEMAPTAMPVMLSLSSPKVPWRGAAPAAKETLVKPMSPVLMVRKSDAGATMGGESQVCVQRFWPMQLASCGRKCPPSH